jgi:hypothetical protein
VSLVAADDDGRQLLDQTPDELFETGVVKDFSLPVVDLESSAGLGGPKSKLERVDGPAVPSYRRKSPGSDGAADAILLMGPADGEAALEAVLTRSGLPMIPTGDAGGGKTGSVDRERFRGAVHRSLYEFSSSGLQSGIDN